MLENILRKIKDQLVEKGQRGLALDIDGTLSWTSGYWFEQMQQRFGNPENLSVKDMIAKYSHSKKVPYWQSQEVMDWLEAERNSVGLNERFPLIKDANHTVQKINTVVPIVLYLTIRPDDQSVIDETKRWLSTHKFPVADIIARPASLHYADGNKWKAGTLEALYPEVIGIIDDDPEVVSHLSNRYQGTVYLYDNVEHPRKNILVVPCKTWQDVFDAVEKQITR